MPRSEKRTRRPPGIRMGVTASEVDFTGADSMEESLRRVARVAPHREVNAMQTAELLIDAGMTKSKSRYNTDTSIHRLMKKSSDFVWIKRGWWRYIGTEATEDAHSTGAVDYMEPEAVPAETETSPAIEDTTAADHTGLESGPAEAEAPETADGTGAADYMEPEAAEPPAPPKTMLWLRGPVQYGGTNSLGDKLQVIAQHTADRTVDPQAVSQRLLLDGQSTARPRNLERVVRRMLRDAPEFHELSLSTEPTDWYQYRPMEARHSCLNDEAYSNKLIYRTGKPEESTFHEEPTYDRIERTGIPAW